MVGLSVLSKPFIELLLGANWSGVAPYLQIVAFAYMWDPVMKFLGSSLKAAGRSADFLRAEAIKKIFGFGILALSVPWGVKGMCWGMIAYAFADMATIIAFSRRISPLLGYRGIARTVGSLALVSLFMGYCVTLLREYMEMLGYSPFMQVFCGAIVGSTIYVCASLLLGRREPKEIFKDLKALLKR